MYGVFLVISLSIEIGTVTVLNLGSRIGCLSLYNSSVMFLNYSTDCFHSCDQHLCKSIWAKESVCIRKEFNSHSWYTNMAVPLVHQHGHHFIVWNTNMATVTSCENALYHFTSSKCCRNCCLIFKTCFSYNVYGMFRESEIISFIDGMA